MAKPAGGLEGTAVLVTGGGTGIGRACAARLAADGAAVTICGRTESKLQDAAKKIEQQAAHGGSVQLIVADVTSEDDVAAAVARAAEPTGKLDGCVANAGAEPRFQCTAPGWLTSARGRASGARAGPRRRTTGSS